MFVPGLYYYQASKYWQPTGPVEAFGDNGKFQSVSVRLYGEYGLSNRLTMVCTLPFAANQYKSERQDNRNSGLTDLELGLRYNLLNVNNRRYLSLQAIGVVPLYQNATKIPYLGYASSGAEAKLLYAGSLKLAKRDAYFNTEVGLRRFFKVGPRPVNQATMLATFGWYVSPKNVLTGELSGLISYSNMFRELNPVNPTVNTDFRFAKATIGYGRQLGGNNWLYANVYTDVYGRNVGIGSGFSLTSVIRF
ncbi:hypothetical protein GCM10028817_36430 [Spirosoma pomorum]